MALARAGLAVFPCQSGGERAKQPMPFLKWREASTANEQQIAAWWRKWPDAAPALDLAKCGLIVIDADRHEHDGVEAFGALMAAHGFDPDSAPIVATPSQGSHHFFRQPAGRAPFGNGRGNLPAGVDVRGAGGYVIAPGTVMADGRVYELHGNLDEAPELPDWLIALLEARHGGDRPTAPVQAREAAGADEIAELLSHVPADCGYHDWVAALMAVHAATGGDGFDIADRWSATGGRKYCGSRELARKWRSFRRQGITIATLADLARRHGADLAAIALKYNRPQGYDPVEAAEASRRLIQHHDDSGAATASELEWFDDVRPTIDAPYLIKGLLDRGAMSVVYGPSNSGKTFFALDVAFHAAIAPEWRRRRVHGGSVLYLAAEGGNGIANRIAALRETTGIRDVPMALRRAGLDLLNPRADTARVVALAGEVERRAPLGLIVIDTLSRVIAGGDENAASDMTAFIKNVDAIRQATRAHVMIVHHTGKDAAKGARGHSSLRAATDTEIEIVIDDFGNRIAKVTKQRDYEGGLEFAFALKPVHLGQDKDGDDITSCVVEPMEKPKETEGGLPPRDTCRAILNVIDEAWRNSNPLSTAPQVKHSGRFAARLLAKQFKLNQGLVQRLLEAWLDNEIVAVEECDNHTKKRGLRVLRWL